jgi:hypothetical protein
MPEFVSFAFTEIQKVGVCCPNCQTEIVIDITEKADLKQRGALPNHCPACSEMRHRPPFFYENSPSWPGYISNLKQNKEAGAIRLYFKAKDSTA